MLQDLKRSFEEFKIKLSVFQIIETNHKLTLHPLTNILIIKKQTCFDCLYKTNNKPIFNNLTTLCNLYTNFLDIIIENFIIKLQLSRGMFWEEITLLQEIKTFNESIINGLSMLKHNYNLYETIIHFLNNLYNFNDDISFFLNNKKKYHSW